MEAIRDRLDRLASGGSSEDLVPYLYRELRRLARALRKGRPRGATLQTTELVHEAYLKLIGGEDLGWEGRAHFFGAAARAMREILVDQARRSSRLRHGGGWRRVRAGDLATPVRLSTENLLAVHEALTRLETEDPRKGEIVNLRFFAGLTTEETADLLRLSARTVEREWRYTRTWLFDQLRAERA